MPLYLFYTMVQKSQKWPKTQIKGGSCDNFPASSQSSPKTEMPRTKLPYFFSGNPTSCWKLSPPKSEQLSSFMKSLSFWIRVRVRVGVF